MMPVELTAARDEKKLELKGRILESQPKFTGRSKQGKGDTWTAEDRVNINVTPLATRRIVLQLAAAGRLVAPHPRKEVVVSRKKA